jgi:aldehyde dehydrogenase (NAD+)
MGELISDEAASRISAALELAIAKGATRLTTEPRRTKRHVVPPTIVQSDDESSAIVQNELFGPVAVVQIARGLSDAVRLANGVRQGLLVAVCSTDQGVIDFVTRESRVGIVQIGGGPVPVHPDAPFGGWGMSGFGTPEHGMWDMQFYTRPRTVYDLSS